MQLSETFRPACWEEVVGQDKTIRQIRTLAKRGLAGNAYWITGKPGTGKSSLAYLIRNEVVGNDPARIFGREIDSQWLTCVRVREVEAESRFMGGGSNGGRAFIVNEAHKLRSEAVDELKVVLERIPAHVVWVFTTTCEQQKTLFGSEDDASALLSRCKVLALAQRSLNKPFAQALVRNCRAAGLLNGKSDDYYIAGAERLLDDKGQNFRAAYQEAEAGYLTANDE